MAQLGGGGEGYGCDFFFFSFFSFFSSICYSKLFLKSRKFCVFSMYFKNTILHRKYFVHLFMTYWACMKCSLCRALIEYIFVFLGSNFLSRKSVLTPILNPSSFIKASLKELTKILYKKLTKKLNKKLIKKKNKKLSKH